jgi:hypothetical protein
MKNVSFLSLAKSASSSMANTPKVANFISNASITPKYLTPKGFASFVKSAIEIEGIVDKDVLLQTFGQAINANVESDVKAKELEFSKMILTDKQKDDVTKALVSMQANLEHLKGVMVEYASHAIFNTEIAEKVAKPVKASK